VSRGVRSLTDCAECLWAPALLGDFEERARWEVRSLTLDEQATCPQAARRQAALATRAGARTLTLLLQLA
jgi:hypothetical protein